MNIKEYIESGLLEAYVLGALSPEEKQRVERDIASHPELAEELKAIEQSMISFAEAGASAPPPEMKEQIWDAIVKEHSDFSVKQNGHDRVQPFPRQEQIYQLRWQRAAVWIALVGSLLANIILWYQRNELQSSQLAMSSRMDSLTRQQEQLNLIVANYRKEQEMMADTTMQPIVMKTMQPGHPMAATVYWSKGTGDAYLSVQKLPVPPQGMQYQLWVMQNGQPVSMGIIPNDMLASSTMMKIPMQVMEGQAFAISLEQEGGSPRPTMEQIQVFGKV